MSYNIQTRASNIEISSQLTGDDNIDTPQKVNIDALKSKILKHEKRENFKKKRRRVAQGSVPVVDGEFFFNTHK